MTDNSPQKPSPQEGTIRLLGIETSCDETAAAVVEDGKKILSNIVASQVDIHAQYGGIFPEIASRQHVITIYPVIEQALQQAHITLEDVDGIAVTRGPGLSGSLVVGLNTAKGIALANQLPIIGVNHLEAHIYSAWLDTQEHTVDRDPKFPLIALIVSGGHTELILMTDHLTYQRLGGTLDDAAGEAFDKIARLLGLDYPGGPAIEQSAKSGNERAYSFPRSWLNDSWDFSFSGLKTAVLREVRRLEATNLPLPVNDIAASFQAAVIEVLVSKTLKAARELSAEDILIAGGVSANQSLRQQFLENSEFPVHIPPLSLCTDNAAMIAGAGYFRYCAGQRDELDMDALPNWPVSELA
ncbi:MAG: tRNA (adenosine(37)-N6)-threonylcarbamoyltransferase complex transferase subunit TsaD [Anaerolineales bacterium]|nr:tRNA (adenosine(37)-N6)-threonylcarbamoyltransferase complex transferase subunit TsaD [Anaerolineales bacterium]